MAARGTRILLLSASSSSSAAASSAAAADAAAAAARAAAISARLHSLRRRPRLLPPRGPLSILGSAGRACLSLLTSPSSRKDFADKIDRGANGVIDPIVLGQADLGLAKVLALYHDLKSEAFRSHEGDVIFRPKEFLEGAKVALARFHEANSEARDLAIERRNEYIHSTQHVEDESADLRKEEGKHGMTFQEKELGKAVANSLLGSTLADGLLPPPPYVDFVALAAQNPDSPEARLVDMVGKESLVYAQADAALRAAYLSQLPSSSDEGHEQYHEFVHESTNVKHMALLSAQAEEIYQAPESDSSNDDDPNAPIEDYSLRDDFLSKSEPAVVASLEVLYDVEQTFAKKLRAVSLDVAGGNEGFAVKEEEDLTRVVTGVYVGTFEGYLRGNSDGEGLRWLLASYRPAFEFGHEN